MIGVVIFAISLVALVNYSQYIILNFNKLYMNSSAIRVLHSTLEKSSMLGEPISGEKNFHRSKFALPWKNKQLAYREPITVLS